MAYIEINIFPPEGVYDPTRAKTLLWVGVGVVAITATGGVAAGVMLSGGTWAVFGTAVVAKATAAGSFIAANASRAIIGATAVKVLKETVAVSRARR